MDLAYIDQLANNGTGWLSRCSVIPKIFLSGTFVAASIASDRLAELLLFLSLLILLNIFNNIPPKRLMHLALYPAFFSLAFALIRFSYSAEEGFIIILKAVNAALAMILLITSTPYTQVFSVLRLFMPGLLVDSMFFTYRIFFILIEQMRNALTVLKFKGGLKIRTLPGYFKHLAGVIALIFINAFTMAERMYNIYSLRGYEGKLYEEKELFKLIGKDLLPVGLSLVILTAVVIF